VKSDPCACQKPAKEKKKPKPRTECKSYRVKQLAIGQITTAVKIIPCE